MSASYVVGEQSKEQQFWQWFKDNEDDLYNIETDTTAKFDRLTPELQKVHPSLTFEFGLHTAVNGEREFIVSADGNKKAFPAVETLVAAAPPLPRWQIIKFRPRRQPMILTVMAGSLPLTIDPSDVRFILKPDGEKAAIMLFFKGYDNPLQTMTYWGASLLFLDQILGEYDVETKVGGIAARPADYPSPLMKKPLSELAEVFDAYVNHTEHHRKGVQHGT